MLSTTKVTIEQVNDNHYEFWITRKGFGVFSNLYDLFGQLIVEENNVILVQTQTDLSVGFRAILYLMVGIGIIGLIDSLNKPNFLIAIFFLCGIILLWVIWNQSRNQFAKKILQELTK